MMTSTPLTRETPRQTHGTTSNHAAMLFQIGLTTSAAMLLVRLYLALDTPEERAYIYENIHRLVPNFVKNKAESLVISGVSNRVIHCIPGDNCQALLAQMGGTYYLKSMLLNFTTTGQGLFNIMLLRQGLKCSTQVLDAIAQKVAPKWVADKTKWLKDNQANLTKEILILLPLLNLMTPKPQLSITDGKTEQKDNETNHTYTDFLSYCGNHLLEKSRSCLPDTAKWYWDNLGSACKSAMTSPYTAAPLALTFGWLRAKSNASSQVNESAPTAAQHTNTIRPSAT